MQRLNFSIAILALALIVGLAATAAAQPVPLQNSTATFSQGGFDVLNTLDNNNGTGWANNGLGDNTAVWETQATTLASPFGKRLEIVFLSGGFGVHTMGRFRISATQDPKSNFADGLQNGGDVTTPNWVPLDNVSISSSNGTTLFTELPDGSYLASGGIAETETYTLIADAPLLTNITGFRMEALEHASLPAQGPGRAVNGNFVVFEFDVNALRDLTPLEAGLPEPATIVIWSLLGGLGLGVCISRSRKRA